MFSELALSELNPTTPSPPRRKTPRPGWRYCVTWGITLYTQVGEPGDISFLHTVDSMPRRVVARMARATETNPEKPVLASKMQPSHVKSAFPAPSPRLKCQDALRGESSIEAVSDAWATRIEDQPIVRTAPSPTLNRQRPRILAAIGFLVFGR
jgi:hypothetical protein